MAKAVADNTGNNRGGFASEDSPILGFSHMHDSGTGGVSLSALEFYRYALEYSFESGTVLSFYQS